MNKTHSHYPNLYAGIRFIPLSGRFTVEGSLHKTDYASIAEAMAARDNHEGEMTNDYGK